MYGVLNKDVNVHVVRDGEIQARIVFGIMSDLMSAHNRRGR
jgi:hypothetical protein